MISRLRQMVEASSLTEISATYGLSPQQLSDVLYGRANLSPKMLTKLNAKMWKFYELLSREEK